MWPFIFLGAAVTFVTALIIGDDGSAPSDSSNDSQNNNAPPSKPNGTFDSHTRGGHSNGGHSYGGNFTQHRSGYRAGHHRIGPDGKYIY